MDKYSMNLKRLEKATNLVRLAIESGTLRDRDWNLMSKSRIIGSLHLLEEGTKRQELYILERQ